MMEIQSESSPAHAMAADEAMFSLSHPGSTVLRVYTWRNPALTIGAFCTLDVAPPISWARRITGGGLVLHGSDLTFAVTTDDLPNREAYRLFGSALVATLRQLDVPAKLAENQPSSDGGTYACFSATVIGDVVVGGKKLVGYAMRRRRGRILMQGSLQLSQPSQDLVAIVSDESSYNQSSCSLVEVAAEQIELEKLTTGLLENLCGLFPEVSDYFLSGITEAQIKAHVPNYLEPDLVPTRR